mmetsp:Transcript_35436/g.140875  ORF Transcript_35436/g.140875 Transcript_35436/m.140875 type:complete len:287 (-) Transcript_35436:131-991(-)
MIPFGKSFTVSAVFLPSVQVVVIVFPLGIVVQCPVGNGQILHGLLTSGQLALVRVKHLREGVVVLPQLFRTCVLWNMENAVMVRCVDDSFNLLFHGPRPLSVIHWCCCWLVIGYVSFPYPSSRFWDGLWIGSRGIDVELSILLSNNIINDCSHLKSLPLPVHQVLIGWTALESFFKRSHRLLVLLSLDFRCTLSPVPLDKQTQKRFAVSAVPRSICRHTTPQGQQIVFRLLDSFPFNCRSEQEQAFLTLGHSGRSSMHISASYFAFWNSSIFVYAAALQKISDNQQ